MSKSTTTKSAAAKPRKPKRYSAELVRVARQTGATVRLIDNRKGKFEKAERGSKPAPWVTLCETHGNYVTHDVDRKTARAFLATPAEFCADCAKLVKAGKRVESAATDNAKEQA